MQLGNELGQQLRSDITVDRHAGDLGAERWADRPHGQCGIFRCDVVHFLAFLQ
jgi:hypothetical protein